jgi:hypothetical protein
MAEWFAPKRYGIGAGKPISWQGWAVTIGYMLLAVGAGLLVRRSLLMFFAILIPATLGFIIVTARTTRGGWRWRSGKED